MKERTFTTQEHIRRAQIAGMALGLVDAIESGVLDTETAQKLLFRPGIFEKYKDDPDLYRLLNLGEELDTVVRTLPDLKETSIAEIKELCRKILSEGKRSTDMEKYSMILNHLKHKGVDVARGLTEEEIGTIEEVYGFTFPRALAEFYSCGFPYSSACDYEFPLWNYFGEENVASIKRRIDNPINWLKLDVKDGFWLKSWGERPENNEDALALFASIAEKAPKLIPIYSHRYIPVIDGVDDPPVISTVGRDTIYYGNNLSEYLQNEFFNAKYSVSRERIIKIPFWSDIIESW